IADAFLAGSVEVGRPRYAGGDAGRDVGLAQRILHAHIGDAERSAGAVILICAPLLILGTLEVGQHVPIRPAGVSELAPGVEILRLTANIEQPVHRAGAAENAPARPWNDAAVEVRLRPGAELPGELRVEHGAEIARGDVQPRI